MTQRHSAMIHFPTENCIEYKSTTPTWWWTHPEGSKGTLSNFWNRCWSSLFYLLLRMASVRLHTKPGFVGERRSGQWKCRSGNWLIERLGKQRDQQVPKAKGLKSCPITILLHDLHCREYPIERRNLCHLSLVNAQKLSQTLLVSQHRVNKQPTTFSRNLHDFVPSSNSFLVFVPWVIRNRNTKKKLNDLLLHGYSSSYDKDRTSWPTSQSAS